MDAEDEDVELKPKIDAMVRDIEKAEGAIRVMNSIKGNKRNNK